MSHTKKLCKMAAPFVVAPPGGARVRTRLVVDGSDRAVLEALGAHLGQLASSDPARRVKEGALDAKANAESRRSRRAGVRRSALSLLSRSVDDGDGQALGRRQPMQR
jgi:hypothetical protein